MAGGRDDENPHSHPPRIRERGPVADFVRGVYHGVWMGIVETNKREEVKQEKQEAQTYALVVRRKEEIVDAKVGEFFPDATTRKERKKDIDYGALDRGYNEGKKIQLSQMQPGASPKMI